MIKKIIQKVLGIVMIISITFSNLPYLDLLFITEVNAEGNYVYLSDLEWDSAVSAWNDARALKKDASEGGLISLLINGEKTYFLKGIFAHATSTVIYNLSDYTSKGYDTFSAYIGVDTYAGSNGNGVKFMISVSEDGENYTVLEQTGVFKGTSDAEKVVLSIAGYNYLKLEANNNGNQASDHSVYADAMLYDSKNYTPKTDTKVAWIKTTSEYDAMLYGKNSTEIVTNANLRLALLQRTLVSNVDYAVLQAWVNGSADNLAVFEWLFKDVNRLEQYILGGTPTGGSYINSLNVLSTIYKNHKEDFASSYTWHATLQKVMFATSLTHATTIASWYSSNVTSNGLGRYEVIKELFEGAAEHKNWTQKTNNGTTVPYTFAYEQFQDLTVEEMRWVTDNKLPDEEFLWLNWYATITKMEETEYSDGKPDSRAEMNPYTYIKYGSGGNVARDDYYVENPKCGVGNEFYNPDKRTSDCYEKYHLTDWANLKTKTKSKPTLWIAFEEDGVCGTLMHVGANLEKVFGTPAAGLGQPGHGAYIYANRDYDSAKQRYYTKNWNTYNWVSDWDQSEKGERMLLDWGTRNRSTVFNSTYNLIYIPLAQQAINDFENYSTAEMYMLLAKTQTNLSERMNCYQKALEYIPYHVTSWYNLLTLKVGNGASSSELKALGSRMMNAVGNAPTAIDELSNIIEDYLEPADYTTYKSEQKSILEVLSKTTDSKYMNVNGVRAVAKRLLGTVDNLDWASFSFDGEDANILKLLGKYASNNATFKYSLDYNYDVINGVDNSHWKEVLNTEEDLSSRLSEINSVNDIAVYIMGTGEAKPDNVYIIDITEGTAPTGLYANDLENKVIGATDKMEWKYENSTGSWTKFTENTKFEGQKTVLVRNGASGTSLASDSVRLTFDIDPEYDSTHSYVSISRLKAMVSTQQNNGNQKGANAIDGNPNTFWHNVWSGADKEKWIQIEVTDGPVFLSKIDYLPRQDSGTNGMFTKTKIEVSLDGEIWTIVDAEVDWAANKTMKSYSFASPAYAKYVRLTAVNSAGNFASAAMINLYENIEMQKISVNDLSVSYTTSGFIYDGTEKKPTVSVKYGDEELINGEHYSIQYVNNINAGTGKIILTGLGIYEGTREFEFTIEKAKNPIIMPDATISVPSNTTSLSEISLPAGWHWANENYTLREGKNVLTIVYDGDENHNSLTMMVTVIKATEPKTPAQDEENIGSVNKNESSNTTQSSVSTTTNTTNTQSNKKKPSSSNIDNSSSNSNTLDAETETSTDEIIDTDQVENAIDKVEENKTQQEHKESTVKQENQNDEKKVNYKLVLIMIIGACLIVGLSYWFIISRRK